MSLLAPGLSSRIRGFPNRKPSVLLPFHPALVSPEWGKFWSNTTGVFPFWSPNGDATKNKAYDLVQRELLTEVAVPSRLVWGIGSPGIFLKTTQTTSSYLFKTGGEQTYFPSSDKGTILVVRRKTDGTNRTSSLIGISEGSQRINIHGPWVDGNIYWDWGGTGGSIKRATWSSYTTTQDIEVWAFTAGPTGLHIYYNGIKRASNDGTAAARTQGSTDFRIGAGASSSNDLQEFYFAATLDVEMMPSEVLHWSRDPFGPFRTRLLPLFTAVVEEDTFDVAQMLSPTPRWDNRMRFY